MPAVQLDKLRLESANLVGKFSQPDLFGYELHEMLDYYSDRTFRTSPTILPGKLFTSYHVPDRIIWQIERDLETQINNYTQSVGLDCARLLWQGETIEEKRLAVFILGKINPSPPKPILATIQGWYHPDLDPVLRKYLVSDGLSAIRRQQFDLWLTLILGWIESDDIRQTAQAFQALTGLLSEEGDRHFPAINRLVQEHIFSLPSDLYPEALQLIQVMIRTSPVEVKFLLNRCIRSAPTENGPQKRLLRKMIDLFNESMKADLRLEYLNHYKK
jgi:hypothetical protein